MKNGKSPAAKSSVSLARTAVHAIRDGFISVIPVLMIGAFSLMLTSLPIPAYQQFISDFLGGLVQKIFSFAYHATFDMLSVYVTVAVAYRFADQVRLKRGSPLAVSITALACFCVLTGFRHDNFTLDMLPSFGVRGMFTAIFAALTVPMLFMVISRLLPLNRRSFSDGSDVGFSESLRVLFPALAIIVVYSLFSYGVTSLFSVESAYDLFSLFSIRMFEKIGRNFFSGFLYVLMSSLLWFCGIHGSDVLEQVADRLFVPALEINQAAVALGEAPTEILSKQFFDNFVLIGGCGSALCLLVALLLFSRRRSNRKLAQMAALPMIFNINEIMVFGLPIIFNQTLFIPFILAPLSSYVLSYLAMDLGLVPLIASAINWTTPIFIGGYYSTGSAAGSLLQLVCLVAGVAIYAPFVRKYDRKKAETAQQYIDDLVSRLKESETQTVPITLTSIGGETGSIAKSLVYDIQYAISVGQMQMFYQPQHDESGKCIGAEALLRWDHPAYGMMYPPLVVKIAKEAGLDLQLEQHIIQLALRDADRINSPSVKPIKISVNVSAGTVVKQEMADYLVRMSANDHVQEDQICIEITEQEALPSDSDGVNAFFSRLRHLGYLLAIDDFSMGHTSIQYLQKNNFDVVKLDGWLVKNLMDNPRCREITSSIMQLSQSLGFVVCAEYVETEQQQRQLAQVGCNQYQGYLYSPALPLDDFISYIADKR